MNESFCQNCDAEFQTASIALMTPLCVSANSRQAFVEATCNAVLCGQEAFEEQGECGMSAAGGRRAA